MSKSKRKVMKKSIGITLALLLAASASLGVTAYADGEAAPGYTEKELTAYYFNNEDKGTIKALFFDDLPSVPYVSAVDYINTVFLNNGYTSEETGDGIYTISGATGSFVVDTVSDTVHFDDYEKFITLRTERENKLPDYFAFGDFELVGELHPTDFDLSAYSIDLQSVDGEVYFPLPLLSDMFSYSFYESVYFNGSVYFIDPFYGEGDSYIDYTELNNTPERSEDMAEYAYSELCFYIDTLYGNPSRTVLHDSIEEKGLDRTLSETSESTAEMKRLLLSTNRAEYYEGLYMLDSYLYDGGHTEFTHSVWDRYGEDPSSPTNADFYDYITTTLSYPDTNSYLYYIQTDKGKTRMYEYKAAAFTEDIIVKKWEGCYYSEYGDTGIFTFDSFGDEIIQPFHESLELAKEHGIRNFVLDLSTNGGGSSCADCYIFSIMLDRDYITYVSHVSGNTYHDHARTDKNLDGVIDEKDDEVSYDFNFAVLASHLSFSSGNMIPVFAKDEGVILLGEHTGGGSCCRFSMIYPEGNSYYSSGDLYVVDANGEDIDLGVEPDYVLYSENEDGTRDYTSMFDFARISADIHEYYGDTIENNNDESTDNNTDAVTDSPDDNTSNDNPATGNLNIYAIAAFAAVSLISATALRKRK